MIKTITRPVVLTGFGCAFCLYILLCNAFSLVVSLSICATTCVILCALVFFTHEKSSCILLILCISLSVFSGIIRQNIHEKPAYSFILAQQFKPDCVYAAKITDCKNYGTYNSADAYLISCDGKAVDKSFKCRLSFYSNDGFEDGNILYFTGTPEMPSNSDSDGFDNISYLRSRNIFITFPDCTVISTEIGKPSLTKAIHGYIEKVIYKYIPADFNLEPADVSYSMLLGDMAFLSKELKDDFSRSGIIHLLCISGMHLTIIMGAAFFFLKALGVGKRLSSVVLIAFCLIYLSIIGFPISAVRAAIICIISYCASLLGRSTDGYSSLFTSLTIICIIWPYSVIDISAQLSFLSALGIITAMELLVNKKSGVSDTPKGIFTTIKSLLATNFGAVMFTYLISAHAFGGISITSIPATFFTSFISEILLIFLLITVLISIIPFLQPVLWFTGFICRICARFIISVARFFSDMRYSYNETENVTLWLIIFIVTVCPLCFFIYFDRKLPKFICIFAIFTMCLFVVLASLINAIRDDGVYKISYFRQNKDDRQLSIKLASQGYLIINADDTLSIDPDKADFDDRYGCNYILILPDESIYPAILASNVQHFDSLYGVKEVFVPNTIDGKALMEALKQHGCNAKFIDNRLDFGTFRVNFEFSDSGTYFCADDGIIKTGVLFSDSYSADAFGKDCHIAAFFTRETKNQFNPEKDTLPHCTTFITRLKKDEFLRNTQNTYGEKSFDIKG